MVRTRWQEPSRARARGAPAGRDNGPVFADKVLKRAFRTVRDNQVKGHRPGPRGGEKIARDTGRGRLANISAKRSESGRATGGAGAQVRSFSKFRACRPPANASQPPAGCESTSDWSASKGHGTFFLSTITGHPSLCRNSTDEGHASSSRRRAGARLPRRLRPAPRSPGHLDARPSTHLPAQGVTPGVADDARDLMSGHGTSIPRSRRPSTGRWRFLRSPSPCKAAARGGTGLGQAQRPARPTLAVAACVQNSTLQRA